MPSAQFLLLFYAISIAVSPIAKASPFPAMTTLSAKPKGFFQSELGFSVDSSLTNWTYGPTGSHVLTQFRAPATSDGVQPALTVRADRLRDAEGLKGYLKSWLKDYERFGFDVIAKRPIKIAGQAGILFDLINRDAERQLRQVVFIRGQLAVTLTCRDHRKTFDASVKACNSIIRTFRWNSQVK